MRTIRWGVYALTLIAGLTIYGHLKLWWEGVEASPAATIYRTRTRTVYVEVPRDAKAEKGLRAETEARLVRVLRTPEGSSARSLSNASSAAAPGTSTAAGSPSGTAGTATGEESLAPEEPALLGIFRIPPLPSGGSGRVTLDESGDTHLEVKAKPERLLALVRLRELGVWGGVRLDDSSVRTWAVTFQQDILRVGPAMLRGRAEYGDEGFGSSGKVELGIAFRF